jgi:hypothetical protein
MLTVRPEGGVRPVPHPPFHFSSKTFCPKCAMLPGMKLQGESGVSQYSPDPPISVDPPRAHPTPTSIVGVAGEVSRQQVACCFPVLRIVGELLPGQEEGKEHAYAAALLS